MDECSARRYGTGHPLLFVASDGFGRGSRTSRCAPLTARMGAVSVKIKPFDAAWFYVERPDMPVHFGPLLILSRPVGSRRDFVRGFVERWRAQRRFAVPFNLPP